jgi:hypothetical protein
LTERTVIGALRSLLDWTGKDRAKQSSDNKDTPQTEDRKRHDGQVRSGGTDGEVELGWRITNLVRGNGLSFILDAGDVFHIPVLASMFGKAAKADANDTRVTHG